MTNFTISVNGKEKQVEVSDDTRLLWAIREDLGMTGTKFSCGIGACGACTVLVDGKETRSCITPMSAVADGQKITTIEGLSSDNSHPLQKAWVDAQVPQCGYCQSGQIMHAAGLLNKNPKPNKQEIVNHMSANLCRCGTYMRIAKAVEMATEES